jgi:hypothetical protein
MKTITNKRIASKPPVFAAKGGPTAIVKGPSTATASPSIPKVRTSSPKKL